MKNGTGRLNGLLKITDLTIDSHIESTSIRHEELNKINQKWGKYINEGFGTLKQWQYLSIILVILYIAELFLGFINNEFICFVLFVLYYLFCIICFVLFVLYYLFWFGSQFIHILKEHGSENDFMRDTILDLMMR